MADYVKYEGHIPFQGRGYRFTGGIQQSLDKRSQIRIRIQNMGWDVAYSRLQAIPYTVRKRLKGALQANADSVAALAKQYVPHGLETDKLYDSIKAMPVGGANSLAYTVIADMPYGHFVEMDVHTSYTAKRRATPKAGPSIAGSVFGARQGDPQGPHYMQRATEDSEQISQTRVRTAFNAAVAEAMTTARRGHKQGLDFDTKAGAQAFAFAKAGVDIGLDAPLARTSGSGIHPLDMELGGL